MPIASHDDELDHVTVGECAFPLWYGVPNGWLRSHGTTRVLVIDDQLTERQDLFGVASENAPLSESEQKMHKWLNVEIQFFPLPGDYRYDSEMSVPRGTFSNSWFERALEEMLKDSKPIAAILLDLLYGKERRIEEASGPHFLSLLRQRLPDVPVLILSNVDETPVVRGIVKEGGDAAESDVSFQDYVPKRLPGRESLTHRLIQKLAEWADLSDPALCAFSPGMRRLARQMRRINILSQVTAYQEQNATFPKPVIISGRIGSGKNYIAGWLQRSSVRRSAPYLSLDFSQFESQNFTTTLFGVAPHSASTELYHVRPDDAAVLAGPNAVGSPRGLLPLASLGLLHRAHIADQPPSPNQTPLRGTLLIDEIGVAPQEMQTRLLRIFNCGRFTPHLTSVEIPSKGALDVWLLVTLSPEGEQSLRDDLRARLGAGWWLNIPELGKRKEDLLPLALSALGTRQADDPGRFLSAQACDLIETLSEAIQVRDLTNLLGGLSEITAKPPYSSADLRESARARRLTDVLRSTERSVPKTIDNAKCSAPSVDRPEGGALGSVYAEVSCQDVDALQALLAWRKAGRATFSAVLQDRDRLRGKGNRVVEGAAIAVLTFLELCAQASSVAGNYSATRTWHFFAGARGTKATPVRQHIADLFEINIGMSIEMLRGSDALLWLALDVSKLRVGIRKFLIDRLAREAGQSERIARLQAIGEESDE